jgi:hypothetical protein
MFWTFTLTHMRIRLFRPFTLKEREPIPAAIGISTLIHSVWSAGRD